MYTYRYYVGIEGDTWNHERELSRDELLDQLKGYAGPGGPAAPVEWLEGHAIGPCDRPQVWSRMKPSAPELYRALVNMEYHLMDDGSMDTVVSVKCAACDHETEDRWSAETAAPYRDPNSGALDFPAFIQAEVIDLGCDYCEVCDGWGTDEPKI